MMLRIYKNILEMVVNLQPFYQHLTIFISLAIERLFNIKE